MLFTKLDRIIVPRDDELKLGLSLKKRKNEKKIVCERKKQK